MMSAISVPSKRFNLGGLLSGLLVSIVTVVLMLAAAEVGVRWLRPQQHLKTEMWVIDPTLGYRLAPNYQGSFSYKKISMPLTTNSWGLRDHEYGPRPEGGESSTSRTLERRASRLNGFWRKEWRVGRPPWCSTAASA